MSLRRGTVRSRAERNYPGRAVTLTRTDAGTPRAPAGYSVTKLLCLVQGWADIGRAHPSVSTCHSASTQKELSQRHPAQRCLPGPLAAYDITQTGLENLRKRVGCEGLKAGA